MLPMTLCLKYCKYLTVKIYFSFLLFLFFLFIYFFTSKLARLALLHLSAIAPLDLGYIYMFIVEREAF